jgi:hypothetical protein
MAAPLLRYAIKFSPVAIEVARQLDRQLRPHVLAYRRAREVDGYVGRWTAVSGTHWLVFPDRFGWPVVAFPPLSAGELEDAARAIDRAGLQHHQELPEARVGDRVRAVTHAPRRLRERGRGEVPPDALP